MLSDFKLELHKYNITNTKFVELRECVYESRHMYTAWNYLFKILMKSDLSFILYNNGLNHIDSDQN